MADQRVDAEAIFAKSRGLSAGEREQYLSSACGGNRELRSQVDALLSAHEATEDSAEHDPLKSDATLSYESDATALMEIGATIGPYKLLAKLGEGGFGSIYVAEQQEPVRRRVALKIIKLGMDTKQVIARFEAERQALALMDHPNIAKVFDAGATESGRPYFVMELVQGTPITEYCDEHQLDTRQRLELLITVCNAIQHAHEKGIVHRDIKPSNVLVATRDDAPAAKVIDFGIAKATHQPLTDKTIFTAANQVIGTPRYMSPEQAGMTGMEIDSRTDIYSLGVLLCELLTGTTPFSSDTTDRQAPDEIYRMIREREPTKPSTHISTLGDTVASVAKSRRTDPNSLRRLLRGDLDWIILRCLEKDRSRRYKSASELAQDLRRHLATEPISASPPSVIYQVQKFTRRRWNLLVATALVVAALTVGVVASLAYISSSLRHARDVKRLADSKLLAELVDAQAELIVLDYSERHSAMTHWLERAESLVTALPSHQTRLDTLAQASAAGTGTQEYGDLKQLVQGIRALDREDGGIGRVKEWASLSPSPAEIVSAWKRVAASLTAADGPPLDPQDRLFPLDRDPQSKRWEFVDLASGIAPSRDSEGTLVIREESGIVFVWLPGGRYLMGSPDDESGRKEDEHQHEVTVSPFLISKYEVTQAQWQKVMRQNSSRTIGPNHPVDTISWFDCQDFCQRTGLRLPTEAQWQYACRAGSTGPYSTAGELQEIGWYKANAQNSTHPVGQKRPNNFGLFDMSGNVQEWCQDAYSADFNLSSSASSLDPVNEGIEGQEKPDRVLLGGSYEGKPEYMRSADRYHEKPDLRWRGFGLRPIRPIR